MKQLVSSRTITIPEGVSVEVKARKVRVKGPRGEFIVYIIFRIVLCGVPIIRNWCGEERLRSRNSYSAHYW